MKVRPREAADQAAARTFLARHHSLGELLDPLDHPALLAEADDVHLLGMLTYVPEQGWEQCERLTLHASEQWHGGTALIEAVEQPAAQHRCARLWLITTNDNFDALRFYRAAASAWPPCIAAPSMTAAAS